MCTGHMVPWGDAIVNLEPLLPLLSHYLVLCTNIMDGPLCLLSLALVVEYCRAPVESYATTVRPGQERNPIAVANLATAFTGVAPPVIIDTEKFGARPM